MFPSTNDFAETHRLKVRRDSDGWPIIRGRLGHIFDGYANGDLGVMISPKSIRAYTFAKRRLLAFGLIAAQEGDSEGIFRFEPQDRVKAKAAIREAKIRSKRLPSQGQIEALARGRRDHLNNVS